MLNKLDNIKLESRLIDELNQQLVRQLWPETCGQLWDQLENQFDKIHVQLWFELKRQLSVKLTIELSLWFELKRQLDGQLNTELECKTN